jgi:HPt (histidine-containing phosphotransfer) domain-containing protein
MTMMEALAYTNDRYDMDALKRLARLGGNDLVHRMATTFAANVPLRLERLRRAADAGDADGVEAVVHSLKGSSAQLGLLTIAQCCARAEERCGDGDLAAALPDVTQIEAELPGDTEWLVAISTTVAP